MEYIRKKNLLQRCSLRYLAEFPVKLIRALMRFTNIQLIRILLRTIASKLAYSIFKLECARWLLLKLYLLPDKISISDLRKRLRVNYLGILTGA